MYPRISIIILNWNGWEDTIECLESLYRIDYPNYDVILIDNGSTDESIQKIKDYCDGKIKVESKFFEYDPKNKPIKIIEYTREEAEAGKKKETETSDLASNRKLVLIKNEKNYGFAEGNNIGIRYALNFLNPDYILLLNNDTVVEKDFLKELVKAAEKDEVGITGPKIYFYDFDGRSDVIQFAGGKVNLKKGMSSHIGFCEIDTGQYDGIKEVDYITGACLLINASVLRKIGLFDPKFFAYWEETDLCMRVKKAGYKVLYVPKAKIWHKVSASWNKIKPIRVYYFTRNRFLFVKKHATPKEFIAFLIYFFGFRFWFESSIMLLYCRDVKGWLSFLKGVVDGVISK